MKYSTLLIFVAFAASVGCQNSGSGNKLPDPKAVTLAKCAQLEKPYSLIGNWISEKQTGETKNVSTVNFTDTNMSITSQFTKSGLTCFVGGSSPIVHISASSFSVINEISDSNFDVKNGEKLDCSLNFPKTTIDYSFNGGCLVLKANGQEETFLPYYDPQNNKPTPRPNDINPTPTPPVPAPSPGPSPIPVPDQPSDPSVPAPIPTPAPMPDPEVIPEPIKPSPENEEILKEKERRQALDVAIDICDSYAYNSSRIGCLERVMDISFLEPLAVTVCKSHAYTLSKEKCILRLDGVRLISKAATQVCSQFAYTSDQESCIMDFDNFYTDTLFEAVCLQEAHVSTRKSCLLSHGFRRTKR